jgi:hypothetical protein
VTGAIRDANANLNPYIDTGHQAMNTLGTMLAPGGDLTKTFDASQMEANDPGYAFRIQQGQLALQRSQAAHGSVQGGGAAKALSDYTQNTASQEYQNAFTRFQQSQQQKYGMLAGTAQMGINPSLAAGSNIMQGTEFGANADIGTSEFAAGGNTNAAQFAGTAGMTAAQIEAQNTMNAAKYSGDTTMGAGNATAAGDINAANSWKGMLGGFSNAAGLYSQLSQPGPTNGGGGFTWTGSPGMGLPPGYAPGLYNPATAGMIP